MNKVFCNKKTDVVEQIINIDIDERFDENWFPNCYVIDDPENKVNAYNLKYNKELENFEVVEELKAKEEVIIEKSEVEKLKEENEELKNKFNNLEEILNKIVEERGV